MNSKLSDSNCKMFIRLFSICCNYNHSLSACVNFKSRLYVSLSDGLFINRKNKKENYILCEVNIM
jgi:hypothetical protein